MVVSIGSAIPSNAASVAAGLGVPIPRVVEAFYRAPTVLVDDVSRQVADQMVELLKSLGYQAKAETQIDPFPASEPLLDVAVYIKDTSRYSEITSALAEFLGASIDEAARLISSPPGIVLGGVSPASVEALKQRLGSGADILASDPTQAIYDLYLAECESLVAQRIISDLRHQGYELLGERGCLLAGLSKKDADQIWSDFRKTGALRVINRDFMRFDIVLTGPQSDVQSPPQIETLVSLIGMPEAIIPEVFQSLPITLIEGAASSEVENILKQLSECGLEVRADMVTFLQLGLEIVAVNEPRNLTRILSGLGVLKQGETLKSIPYQLPYHMPELQARLLRDSLAAHGAQTVFVEPKA